MFRCLDLIPMRLPKDCGLRRDPVIRAEARAPDHDTRYDWDTLVYSATYLADQKAIVLVCPRLLNLTPLLRKGQFRSSLGGHSLRRHKVFRRHEEIFLHATANPGTLTLHAQGMELSMTVADRDAEFDGQTVLMTKSRDNDLDWIGQWAAHYVATQGVSRVLIYDNGSTAYTPQALLQRLAAVPGLGGAVVVRCDPPFGPLGTRSPVGRALFFQLGMLNTSRHRFVSRARAVIYCDVDEVLVSDHGTLRDVAEAGWLKYATARAHWRYTDAPQTRRPEFGDHVLRMEPETHSKEKWCLVPTGPLRRVYWDCHGVGRYTFNRICMSAAHRFYHCAQITTGWKGSYRWPDTAALVRDEATIKAMTRLGFRASV